MSWSCCCCSDARWRPRGACGSQLVAPNQHCSSRTPLEDDHNRHHHSRDWLVNLHLAQGKKNWPICCILFLLSPLCCSRQCKQKRVGGRGQREALPLVWVSGERARRRAGRIALCGLALSMSQLSSLSSSGTLIVKVKKQLWCSDWTRGERKQCVRTSNSFAARPSSVLSAHSRRLRCVRFTPANRLCRRAIWRNIRAQVGQRQLINKLEQQQHNR